MKVLYISQTAIDLNQFSIYSDLSNAILNAGHSLTLICANSKIKKTEIIRNENLTQINVKVANQFGVNLIKKAFIIMSLKNKMINVIKKYLSNEKFDLVIYSTPPITFAGVVSFCKKKFHCKSYLMLKDIFPQNAVDLGMLKKTGLKGFIYRYFKKQEKKLFLISDRIGGTSLGNVKYLKTHYDFLKKEQIELFPNASFVDKVKKTKEDINLLKRNGIPCNKILFLYGGNLGKPQGLNFLIKCFNESRDVKDVHFIIIGKGSEKDWFYSKIQEMNISNISLLKYLPANDYEKLCSLCDVGMISLDYRNTTPNTPGKLLSYMKGKQPVFAITDKNTDLKHIIKTADCGVWMESVDSKLFLKNIKWFVKNKSKLKQLGLNGRKYFEKNFNVEDCVKKLENLAKEEK